MAKKIESDWTVKLDREVHWRADDSEFSVACDLAIGEEVEITCVRCLNMLVVSQNKRIIELMRIIENQPS